MREQCRLRVFENRVLRKIFEPKRDKVTGEWRKLHKEEFDDIFCVIKSRRMRWVGHVARMRERRIVYRVLVGRHHLEDLGVAGILILKLFFK